MIADKTATIESLRNEICKEGPGRLFSDTEYSNFFNGTHYSRIAARLLAKKIIGETLPELRDFRKLTILSGDFGQPILVPDTEYHEMIRNSGIRAIRLSLSHSRNYARAVVHFEYA